MSSDTDTSYTKTPDGILMRPEKDTENSICLVIAGVDADRQKEIMIALGKTIAEYHHYQHDFQKKLISADPNMASSVSTNLSLNTPTTSPDNLMESMTIRFEDQTLKQAMLGMLVDKYIVSKENAEEFGYNPIYPSLFGFRSWQEKNSPESAKSL